MNDPAAADDDEELGKAGSSTLCCPHVKRMSNSIKDASKCIKGQSLIWEAEYIKEGIKGLVEPLTRGERVGVIIFLNPPQPNGVWEDMRVDVRCE